MKNEKKLLTVSTIRFIVVLPLAVTLVIAFTSCKQNKNAEATFNEVAPPPPPPPPAAPIPDSVFTAVDEMPVFHNGDTSLLNYIAKHTTYPADAKMNKITGKVVVAFVVNKDGTVSSVKVLKGVSPSIDAESVRVVSTLPKFEKPGIKDGVPVAVNYMVPITFTLK